ncbi:hypothetical protein [Hyphomonas sp.]|uniref:hypothetical protein n=1 Tax=Hyphomonas sp. TaxID=87 RepID=UPI003241D672
MPEIAHCFDIVRPVALRKLIRPPEINDDLNFNIRKVIPDSPDDLGLYGRSLVEMLGTDDRFLVGRGQQSLFEIIPDLFSPSLRKALRQPAWQPMMGQDMVRMFGSLAAGTSASQYIIDVLPDERVPVDGTKFLENARPGLLGSDMNEEFFQGLWNSGPLLVLSFSARAGCERAVWMNLMGNYV